MAIQLKDYEVYADTSSLLDKKADVFWGRIVPRYLIEKGMRIIIPRCVIKDLKRTRKGMNPSLSETAEKILVTLEYLWNNGLADVPEEKGDEPIIQYFEQEFSQMIKIRDICLITEDETLARKIIVLKKSLASVSSKDLKVLYFKHNPMGDIESNLQDWESRLNPRALPVKYAAKPFTLYGGSITPKHTPNPVSSIPVAGHDVITRNNGRIRLLKKIAGGGEGIVYSAGNGSVCKIYKKEELSEEKQKKLEFMQANPINYPGICWPLDLVYNSKGEFVGYSMERAQGRTIDSCLFGIQDVFKYFGRWKRENLVNCSVQILKRIAFLNEMNIILGDINPFNIMVKSENEVYLIDTDSYQVEQYPCLVGTDDFTAPEIQGKTFGTFFRTLDHENFAIATLVFKLLFYGKSPYAKIGGGTTYENIQQMDFPYPLDQTKGPKVPLGPFLDIWMNLPFRIRDAFYDVLKNNKRKSSSEWLELIKCYRDHLRNGLASNELVPTGLYRPNRRTVMCSSCGRQFMEGEGYLVQMSNSTPQTLCPSCGQTLKKNSNLQSQSFQGLAKKSRPFGNKGAGGLLNQFFQP
ncbi:MAG: hypothetical protein JW765_05400 [Deltaproteobacteria bacterium]|nr:hypothetical protein [Candidatus Zymogenaceae bacterium]